MAPREARIAAGVLAAAMLVLASQPVAARSTHGAVDASEEQSAAWAGEWSVDLRLSLDDPPYAQPMTLSLTGEGEVAGSFYGSPIEAGRAGEAKGRTCLSFRTSDDSGPYFHAACLEGEKMTGQSWSAGRGFVLPWTATRIAEKD